MSSCSSRTCPREKPDARSSGFQKTHTNPTHTHTHTYTHPNDATQLRKPTTKNHKINEKQKADALRRNGNISGRSPARTRHADESQWYGMRCDPRSEWRVVTFSHWAGVSWGHRRSYNILLCGQSRRAARAGCPRDAMGINHGVRG